jgi:murein DD-endopeptidase MepM/ murein hydrolase activator NlpD
MKRFKLIISLMVLIFPVMAQFNTVLPRQQEAQTAQNQVEANEAPEAVETVEVVEPLPFRDVFSPQRREVHERRRFLSLPIDEIHITSPFGMREHPITGDMQEHRGVDLRARNDYVYAIMPGQVVRAGRDRRLGNFVEIQHGDFRTIYGHLYTLLVNTRQAVEAGQPIGISGNTGQSTGEHLHFGIRHRDIYIDPAPILEYIHSLIHFVQTDLSDKIYDAIRDARNASSFQP